MLYLDTSAIVKLYVKEKYSRDLARWLTRNNEAIPLTNFHELEFTNAVNLKRYRGEISNEDAQHIILRFNTHTGKGIFYSHSLDWVEVFKLAIELSDKFTPVIGSRSLDIMHVASALSLEPSNFITFDERQEKIASQSGLHIIACSSLV